MNHFGASRGSSGTVQMGTGINRTFKKINKVVNGIGSTTHNTLSQASIIKNDVQALQGGMGHRKKCKCKK